jgi:hypothetical protein
MSAEHKQGLNEKIFVCFDAIACLLGSEVVEVSHVQTHVAAPICHTGIITTPRQNNGAQSRVEVLTRKLSCT